MKVATAFVVLAGTCRACHSFVALPLRSFSSLLPRTPRFVSTSDEAPTTTSIPHEENQPTGALTSVTTNAIEEEAKKEKMLSLPKHSHDGVNEILIKTEEVLRALQDHADSVEELESSNANPRALPPQDERIYANAYVDMSKVDVVGFDYDYTLVTYTDELLELIYEMALSKLVHDFQYPSEMLDVGLKFDPLFSIRGLAVDKETGWICHLSYTHKVSVAWEGREKLPSSRIYQEYRGKRGMRPSERKKRLKPLNDLFSMAECCLIADTIQFFKDRDIPFCPMNAATDVLSAIRETHISGDFHRIVAENPEQYFLPAPHIKQVLNNLKEAGKSLIFVSNSPFWYVDAGMRYFMGENWMDSWDAVITSAGKPRFYTDDARPFREVSRTTGRIKFKKVDQFEPGEVYTEGCLKELIRLMKWGVVNGSNEDNTKSSQLSPEMAGATTLSTSQVLYIGDSLFADLVDAKREFGWTTAAVAPEVGFEMHAESTTSFVQTQRSIDLLVNALRLVQEELGPVVRTQEDNEMLDCMEKMVSRWRDKETSLLGNSFGSIFRARHQPSLFAHSLRRYCDLYMSTISNLRHYSPQHRFYPEQGARLLAHEIQGGTDCWDLEDVLGCTVPEDMA
ncbi:nucleotidase domain-containing protein 3 [Seminavis robusta]|uniref:Nucleotidase domain-containing protein 3 n=1 Tax=Seminavis robusta TaxID=568900 RepID=A0A9N8HBE3_9STRA|nr:nucleotidase domain-containing protein 3 [Seminavis robusta]|eukprot:Sro273_g105250.1 nucleotidase domain-containing protein 3 (622) ;mRNA; r:73264-75400